MSKSINHPKHHTRKRSSFPYEIAVLSEQSAEIVRDQTLALLKQYSIPADKISVWIRGPGQEKLYKSVCIPGSFARICSVSATTESEFYNTIAQSYLPGTPIMYIKDTVTEIHTLRDGSVKPVRSLLEFLHMAFSECAKEPCTLWGIQPTTSTIQLRPTIQSSLQTIGSELWGTINQAPFVALTLNTCTELERTIKHYNKDGAILRFNMIGVKTSQSSPSVQTKEYAHVAKKLLQLYPNYVHIRPDKQSNTFTIRLKDVSETAQSDQK